MNSPFESRQFEDTRRSLRRRAVRHLLAALALVCLPGGAAARPAGNPANITKVNYHHLTSDAGDQQSIDPMIRFERRHLLHGANTLAEQQQRYGSYYSVFWDVADRGRPVTLRFEYRLQNTGPAVKIRELEVLDIKRRNIAKFSVTGDEFAIGGKVSAWRALVMRDGEVLATYESFLWD